MLAYHELVYLKEIHPDFDLIYVSFEDQEFVFRSLTKEEYREIITIIVNDNEFEDAVCQCCLVYPEEYDFSQSYLPGLSSKVVKHIIDISYLNNPKALINMYDMELASLNNFDEQCITFIKAAFPEYEYEKIRTWSWKKIIQYTARAERIMKLKGLNVGLINNYEEFQEKIQDETEKLTDYDIGNGLREQGVDPMEYFSYEFDKYEDKIDYPIIGTYNWRDESIIGAIRKQMELNEEYEEGRIKEFTILE